jgi:hypothetical protein
MNMALASTKIDTKIKQDSEWILIYINSNPQFAFFRKAVAYFDGDPEVNVTKEIGKFYQNKKQWNTAIGYYENRMLKVWISIWRRICFASIVYGGKSLKKQ